MTIQNYSERLWWMGPTLPYVKFDASIRKKKSKYMIYAINHLLTRFISFCHGDVDLCGNIVQWNDDDDWNKRIHIDRVETLQCILSRVWMYLSYGIIVGKLIDCGELYGLNDSASVKCMLKWLKILFDQSLDLFLYINTVFITRHLLIRYLFVHRMICVDGLWIGSTLNVRMVWTIELLNSTKNHTFNRWLKFSLSHSLTHSHMQL